MNKINILLLVIVFKLLISLNIPVYAQDFPAHTSSFVNDFANLIDEETEGRLTKTLSDLRQDHGIEMTVVTIQKRTDYGADTGLEPFTTGLFNTWGVGNNSLNNGILFLVSQGDRETRIELGSGYGPEYDDRMKLVIDHTIVPFFRNGAFAQGIESGVLEIIKRTSTDFVGQPPENKSWWAQFNDKLIILLAAGAILALALRRRANDALTRFRKCPRCGTRELTVERRITITPSKTQQGQEDRLTLCNNCDYEHHNTRTLRRTGSNNSSGGGSFGGGSSSGGGASGRW